MATTQKERVQLAVETAEETAKANHQDPTTLTAEEIAETMGYEPSANELKAFRKAWNARQQEIEEKQDDSEIVVDDISEEVESVEEDPAVIDPFADDDEEVPASTKVDDRRAAAIERARELLGDQADTAAPEEAILALRHEGHPFYAEMRASASQASKFTRDYRKTQPGGETRGGPKPLRKSVGFQEDLQDMRANLSAVRKTTEKGEAIRMLGEVRDKAQEIIAKVEAFEES